MSHAKNELDRVADRYDPENDLIDGAPRVTHTDKVLIDVVEEILEEIGDRAAIEDIHDILSYVRDLGMIRAEVLAISKDLFAIKEELGAKKIRRLRAELEEYYDFEMIEKLPEVAVRAALAAVIEILAE